MTGIANIVLTGFFVWSGAAGLPVVFPQPNTITIASTTTASAEEVLSVRLTGYNAVPEQTDENPEITASGASSNPSVIAARSPDLGGHLPYGTIIALETPNNANSCGYKEVKHLIGYRVIADSTHSRKHRQIDVMFDETDVIRVGGIDTNPAVVMGICKVNLRVVGKIAVKDIPNTQAKLALLVNKSIALK